MLKEIDAKFRSKIGQVLLRVNVNNMRPTISNPLFPSNILSLQGIYNGINSVRKIVTNHCPELASHYHGLVADKFTCDSSMHKIIDVVARNKIFMHIVDADVQATKILCTMNKLNLPGSPMFLSINRLTGDTSNQTTTNKRSLLNKLKFDPKFDSVMRHIFGKVLICRDLEHAVQEARNKPDTNCVTLSGDVVQPFGPISGGHIHAKSLRIDTFHEWTASALAVNTSRGSGRKRSRPHGTQ